MAISWSSWHYSGNNGMRIGIDYSWGGLSGGNKRTITWKIYTHNQYRYNDNQKIDLDDDFSGSQTISYSNTQNAGVTKLRGTRTYTYTYKANEYGSSPGTVTLRADVIQSYNGSRPGKRRTVSIPARPIATPAPPSNLTVMRETDSRVSLSWVNNNTGSAPYTTVEIQRRELSEDGWSNFSTLTTLAGSLYGFIDTTVTANRAYDYQIRATNNSGSSEYAASATTPAYMTPAAVTDLVAGVSGSGTSIDVTWTNNAYDDPGNMVRVERSVNGGAYSTVTNLAAGSESWTDATPGAGTNQYRIRIYRTTPFSLNSSTAVSNSVTTIVPPLAPTTLNPNGVKRDFTQDQIFSWRHNHGGDGAAQTHYTMQVSSNGGSTWTAFQATNIASSVSSIEVPGGTLSNGLPYVWRVQTQGNTGESFGPFSASASVVGEAAPVIALTSPPSTVNTLPVSVDWTYSQASGNPQTLWLVQLYHGPVVDFENLIETYSDFGDDTSVELGVELIDGQTYTIRLFVQSTDGILSNVIDHSFTIDLLNPVEGVLEADYDACSGTVDLAVSIDDSFGLYDDADHFDIQRQLPNGDWLTIASGLPPRSTYPEQYTEDFDGVPEEPNYGWDTNTDNDTKDPAGPLEPDSSVSVNGGYSLKESWIVSATAGRPQWVGYEFADLIPGQEYTMVSSVYMSANSGPIRPEMLGSPGTYGPVIEGAPNTWIENAFTFVPDGNVVNVGFSNLAPDEGQTLNIDKVVLYVGSVTGYDETLPDPLLVTDTVPDTTGTNTYRVITYALSGTATIGPEVSVDGTNDDSDSCGWVFVSYGRGFKNILRVGGDIDFAATTQRQRGATHYLGRSLPLLGVGAETDVIVQVSGVLMWPEEDCVDDPCDYDSSADDWEEGSLNAGIVCYRDYTGRRFFGSLSEVVIGKGVRKNTAPISFTVTQTQYTERTGLLMGAL